MPVHSNPAIHCIAKTEVGGHTIYKYTFLSGWLGGPMPTVGQKEEVATGWEEPSPESIRRRMEIDDGTAAWGDPGKESNPKKRLAA